MPMMRPKPVRRHCRQARLHAAVRAVIAVAACLVAEMSRGDRVELTDGRVLEGRFTTVAGVATDPLSQAIRPGPQPVVVCDDDLTRTMVPKRRLARVEPVPFDAGVERVLVPQRIPEGGRRVAAVGGIVAATPFDEFGRRILSLSTADGTIDVVQGITEITPKWIRVEGVQTEKPLLLDMRLAATSISPDVLRRVVEQHIDRTNPDQRLRLVRLLLQGERYDDARRALDAVVADFPDLADLAKERQTLARLSAGQLLDEILLRGRAGQDRLAIVLLDNFPTNDAGGEILAQVREARTRYQGRRDRATALVAAIRDRLGRTAEADRDDLDALIAEIEGELTFHSLERLTTFERVGMDPALPPDRAVALAVSGWLQGPAAGGDNLKLARSAIRVRGLVREYLRSVDGGIRDDITDRIRSEEAGDVATLAAIAAHMRPPLDPPPETSPGLHELAVVPHEGEEAVSCLVQLPPEYDPLRRYPTIVSLHAAWSSPLNQVEWWAGLPAADGIRLGQATRRGWIVVAPAWTRRHQSAYEYSAREHAAVLASLREVSRRFSIDTDRVFISGHSMGGDAAWDVALAHPDLWAGLVAIVPAAGRYVTHYWPNARTLPIYVVGGELDHDTRARNAVDLDRYCSRGFDVTYVEYRGRGHENFSDEIQRIFDWMSRKRRSFFPAEIDAVAMRPWDRFFWWLDLEGLPAKTAVLPQQWPPPPGTRPFSLEARTGAANSLSVRCGAERVRIWLTPDLVDFTRPVTVTLDGQRLVKGPVRPDERVLLEDLRLRADRQHPFWAVVESTRPPR